MKTPSREAGGRATSAADDARRYGACHRPEMSLPTAPESIHVIKTLVFRRPSFSVSKGAWQCAARVYFLQNDEILRANVGNAKKVVLAAHQANGEPMHTEDILTLESVGIVAAEHILIAQAVGEDG